MNLCKYATIHHNNVLRSENQNEEHYKVRLKTNRLSISSDFFNENSSLIST